MAQVCVLNLLLCYPQAGKITQQEAEAYKEKLLMSQGLPSNSRTKSISEGQYLFNFHVIKWTKARSVQRLILQVLDWCVHVLACNCWDVVSPWYILYFTVEYCVVVCSVQFDFQSETLCCIQHGTRTKKHEFCEIISSESEVGDPLGLWNA